LGTVAAATLTVFIGCWLHELIGKCRLKSGEDNCGYTERVLTINAIKAIK
jgi:hypothetical protein